MEKTLQIKVIDQKVLNLLHELEELNLIKVLKKPVTHETALSNKYRNIFSKEDAADFKRHTQKMREEWSNT